MHLVVDNEVIFIFVVDLDEIFSVFSCLCPPDVSSCGDYTLFMNLIHEEMVDKVRLYVTYLYVIHTIHESSHLYILMWEIW